MVAIPQPLLVTGVDVWVEVIVESLVAVDKPHTTMWLLETLPQAQQW
jgi:hypothetical protein